MACMKCGKEVSGSQVFCDACLQDMEQYPIKPGTPVLLPNRPSQSVVHKRSARRSRKPEEQISGLKNALTWLCVFCCLLMVALTLSVMLNLQLLGNNDIHILPGQNYNTSENGELPGGDTAP